MKTQFLLYGICILIILAIIYLIDYIKLKKIGKPVYLVDQQTRFFRNKADYVTLIIVFLLAFYYIYNFHKLDTLLDYFVTIALALFTDVVIMKIIRSFYKIGFYEEGIISSTGITLYDSLKSYTIKDVPDSDYSIVIFSEKNNIMQFMPNSIYIQKKDKRRITNELRKNVD